MKRIFILILLINLFGVIPKAFSDVQWEDCTEGLWGSPINFSIPIGKNRIVNEKVLASKTDYNKLLSEISPKIPFGKIDNTFKMGDWDVYVKGDVAGSAANVTQCKVSRVFSFGNKTIAAGVTWGPNTISLFGTMDDSTSIKANVMVLENEGKLSIAAESVDPFSYIRRIILRDGEAPEVYLNNGQKDTVVTGIIVHFSNVQKGGDNISLNASLDMDFGTGVVVDGKNPLKVWPNLNIWFAVDVTNAKAQNYMELSVHDTVKFTQAIGNGHGFDYKPAQSLQVLKVEMVEGYAYPGRKDSYYNQALSTNGGSRRNLKGVIYELGERDWGAGLTAQRAYIRSSAYHLPDSVNGLPVYVEHDRHTDPYGPMVLFGDLTNLVYPYPNVKADFFSPVMVNNVRKERFAVRPYKYDRASGTTYWVDGDTLVSLEFEKTGNGYGQYFLIGERMEYVRCANELNEFGSFLTPVGYGTDTTMAYNTRVRVIDNRHVIIEDVAPESMKGERFFVPQSALTPYTKNADTAQSGVNDYSIERKNYFYSYPPYPLPAGEVVQAKIFWDIALDINTANIKVYDVYGKEISDGKDIEIIPESGWSGTLLWNCRSVTSGVYLITIKYGTERKVIKVVKG